MDEAGHRYRLGSSSAGQLIPSSSSSSSMTDKSIGRPYPLLARLFGDSASHNGNDVSEEELVGRWVHYDHLLFSRVVPTGDDELAVRIRTLEEEAETEELQNEVNMVILRKKLSVAESVSDYEKERKRIAADKMKSVIAKWKKKDKNSPQHPGPAKKAKKK
jgi:hypothetical protein